MCETPGRDRAKEESRQPGMWEKARMGLWGWAPDATELRIGLEGKVGWLMEGRGREARQTEEWPRVLLQAERRDVVRDGCPGEELVEVAVGTEPRMTTVRALETRCETMRENQGNTVLVSVWRVCSVHGF